MEWLGRPDPVQPKPEGEPTHTDIITQEFAEVKIAVAVLLKLLANKEDSNLIIDLRHTLQDVSAFASEFIKSSRVMVPQVTAEAVEDLKKRGILGLLEDIINHLLTIEEHTQKLNEGTTGRRILESFLSRYKYPLKRFLEELRGPEQGS